MTGAASEPPPTKERIRASAAELFHRKGYAATGIKEIVTNASAPFASLYHFYPGGKVELAETVIRTSGAMFQELVLLVWDAAPDVQSSVHDIFAGAAMTLELTDYADACPIAVIALEVASTNEVLRIATDDVFTAWLSVLTGRLEQVGIETAVSGRSRGVDHRVARGCLHARPGLAELRADLRRRCQCRPTRRPGLGGQPFVVTLRRGWPSSPDWWAAR